MNIRNANGHRRRTLRARVIARDTHCWLCKRPIDKNLNTVPGKHGPKCRRDDCHGCVPHPLRAEVHELIPVSRGGSPYDPKNCVLCCRQCNNWIGNRTPAELAGIKQPAREPVRTTIQW
jgi:5-methylcytosine-specific restriction endonuclease McrA